MRDTSKLTMMRDLKVLEPLTLNLPSRLICVALFFEVVFLSFLCFFLQISTNVSTTLASTANASTQTALSGVNAPWDTIWTSAASDAKVSSFPLLFSGLFKLRFSNATSVCDCRHQRMRRGQPLRQRHLH